MSTSLLERNATLFWNVSANKSLGDIQMKKSCNINGPASLNELGRSFCGLQKLGCVTQPRNNQGSDAVNIEYINSPPNLLSYPAQPRDNDRDPFNEQLAVSHGGYGGAYCSANANMYVVRPNPNSITRLNWSFRVDRAGSKGVDDYGIVCATYTTKTSQGGTVIMSDTRGVGYGFDASYDIDIPANGHDWVVFSCQHTAGPTGSGSTKYGAAIINWQVKYR